MHCCRVPDLIPYCGYPDDDNEDVPLVTGRSTYLALWNDVDLYGKYVEEQGTTGHVSVCL